MNDVLWLVDIYDLFELIIEIVWKNRLTIEAFKD